LADHKIVLIIAGDRDDHLGSLKSCAPLNLRLAPIASHDGIAKLQPQNRRCARIFLD
jgi:hypothetical protein